MKIRPVGGELFRACAETDMTTKLTVAFHSSANGPKGGKYHQTRRFEVLKKMVSFSATQSTVFTVRTAHFNIKELLSLPTSAFTACVRSQKKH